MAVNIYVLVKLHLQIWSAGLCSPAVVHGKDERQARLPEVILMNVLKCGSIALQGWKGHVDHSN